MSTYNDFFGFIPQVPNLAPNERYLPAADYGRVGALKLVEKIYRPSAVQYVNAGNGVFGNVGRYHYYLLGRKLNTRENDGRRAALNVDVAPNSFYYPNYDVTEMVNGPHYFAQALEHLNESARIYQFNPSLVVGAFLTLVNEELTKTTAVGIPGDVLKDGFNVAKYNPGALESLWGQREIGYPNTYRINRGIAARGDYGGKRKGKGRKGKKKRSKYY